MKEFNLRTALIPLLGFVFFFFASTLQVKAQTTISPVYQHQYVTAVSAQQILHNEIKDLQQILSTLKTNDPEYRDTASKYFLYKAILENVEKTGDVPRSIINGLRGITSDAFGFNLNRSEWQNLQQMAIDLLKI